jgi:hypothetical protein
MEMLADAHFPKLQQVQSGIVCQPMRARPSQNQSFLRMTHLQG